jgi:hypothetical protein
MGFGEWENHPNSCVLGPIYTEGGRRQLIFFLTPLVYKLHVGTFPYWEILQGRR